MRHILDEVCEIYGAFPKSTATWQRGLTKVCGERRNLFIKIIAGFIAGCKHLRGSCWIGTGLVFFGYDARYQRYKSGWMLVEKG